MATTVTGPIGATYDAVFDGISATLTRVGGVVGYAETGGAIAPDQKTYVTSGGGVLTMENLKPGRYTLSLSVPISESTAQTKLWQASGVIQMDAGDNITLDAFLTANVEPLTPTLVQQAIAARDVAVAAAGESEGFRNETLGFRNDAEGFRNETLGFRNDAEGFRDQSAASAAEANTFATQAELAALAAGAPLVTALPDPVPANGTIVLLHQDSRNLLVYEVVAGAWVNRGYLIGPYYKTVPLMLADNTVFPNGTEVQVGRFRYEADSAASAGTFLENAGGVKLKPVFSSSDGLNFLSVGGVRNGGSGSAATNDAAWLLAKAIGSPGKIYFPKGDYWFSESLVVDTDNTALVGDPSTVNIVPQVNFWRPVTRFRFTGEPLLYGIFAKDTAGPVENSRVRGIEVHNITVDGRGIVDFGIHFSSYGHITKSNAINCNEAGCFVELTFHVHIDLCTFSRNNGHGLWLGGDNGTQWSVTRCQMNQNDGYGWYQNSGSLGSADSCVIELNFRGGMKLEHLPTTNFHSRNTYRNFQLERNGRLDPDDPNWDGNAQLVIAGSEGGANTVRRAKFVDSMFDPLPTWSGSPHPRLAFDLRNGWNPIFEDCTLGSVGWQSSSDYAKIRSDCVYAEFRGGLAGAGGTLYEGMDDEGFATIYEYRTRGNTEIKKANPIFQNGIRVSPTSPTLNRYNRGEWTPSYTSAGNTTIDAREVIVGRDVTVTLSFTPSTSASLIEITGIAANPAARVAGTLVSAANGGENGPYQALLDQFGRIRIYDKSLDRVSYSSLEESIVYLTFNYSTT